MNKIKLFVILIIWWTILLPKSTIKLDISKQFELGKKDILFEDISHTIEDRHGNFYVLDAKAPRVYKFSNQGMLILTFGNRGEGPGDFIMPHKIYITPEDNVIVNESRDFVSLFSKDGKFLKRIKVPNGLELNYLNSNLFYAWDWVPEGKKQVLLNQNGEIKKSFYSISRETFSVNVPDETGRLVMFNYFNEDYCPFLIHDRYDDYSIMAVSNKYEITLVDNKGDILRKINRSVKPYPISSEEKKYFLEMIDSRRNLPGFIKKKFIKKIPKYKNYFSRILITEKYIWIFRIKENIVTDKFIPIDLFSIEGKYIGSVKIKNLPIYISSKYMYFDETDADDDLLLVRYTYNISF